MCSWCNINTIYFYNIISNVNHNIYLHKINVLISLHYYNTTITQLCTMLVNH
nr:MAG TPA: hypothetical protein [Caudoviricetes sp.]